MCRHRSGLLWPDCEESQCLAQLHPGEHAQVRPLPESLLCNSTLLPTGIRIWFHLVFFWWLIHAREECHWRSCCCFFFLDSVQWASSLRLLSIFQRPWRKDVWWRKFSSTAEICTSEVTKDVHSSDMRVINQLNNDWFYNWLHCLSFRPKPYLFKGDHKYPGSNPEAPVVILYGEFGTPGFERLHQVVSSKVHEGLATYVLRHYVAVSVSHLL